MDYSLRLDAFAHLVDGRQCSVDMTFMLSESREFVTPLLWCPEWSSQDLWGLPHTRSALSSVAGCVITKSGKPLPASPWRLVKLAVGDLYEAHN